MRHPSRTRATLAAFAAFGALIGTLLSLSGAGDAPAMAAFHGATLGTLAGSTLGFSLLLLLMYDGDRVLRR